MSEERWLAKVRPVQLSVDDMLQLSFGLDVWERRQDFVIAAAAERVFCELERRGVARVERISTVRDYIAARAHHERSGEP